MRTVPLAEILEESRSGFWGSDPGAGAADVRVIRNGDIQNDGVRWDALPLRGVSYAEADRAAIREGDILITTSGNCGSTAHVAEPPREPTIASNFVRILRFNPDTVVPRYIFHVVHSDLFRSRLSPYIRGTTLKNLSLSTAAERIDVPLPGVKAQRRIAQILDQADALRAKRQAALDQLDTLAQSIFLDMFGDPLARNEGSGDHAPLKAVTRRITYGFTQPMKHLEVGIPIITAKNVRNGFIDFELVHYADTTEFDALTAKSKPTRGDVLITKDGTIGRCAVVEGDEPFCINQSVALIQLDLSRVLPTYAVSYLSTSRVQRVMKNMGKGNALTHLQITELAELSMPLPALGRQHEFASRVGVLERAKLAQRTSLSWLDSLISSLQSSAFRSELLE